MESTQSDSHEEKKERFQKRREFLFMCWLNKVQVNDMEKQF